VPSKHKTLSSNSSITPQKLKKKQNNDMYVWERRLVWVEQDNWPEFLYNSRKISQQYKCQYFTEGNSFSTL
jgi:hypothetical protein